MTTDLHIPPVMCVSDGYVTAVLAYRAPIAPGGPPTALVRVEHPDRPTRVRIVALRDVHAIPITSFLIGDPCDPS